METAQFGGTQKGGIRRLTLSNEDRQVRDWFKLACEAIGCTVTVDDCGNMFARRPASATTCRRSAWALISIHSRPAASSTASSASSARWKSCAPCTPAGYETNAPHEIVNWTNEEGSRFAPPCWLPAFLPASSPAISPIRARIARARYSSRNSIASTIGARNRPAAQDRRHVRAPHRARPDPRSEGKTIGVVTGVQGMRWYEVTVTARMRIPARHPCICAKTPCWGPRA